MEISSNWISWVYIVSESASFFGHFAFAVNMWIAWIQTTPINLHLPKSSHFKKGSVLETLKSLCEFLVAKTIRAA